MSVAVSFFELQAVDQENEIYQEKLKTGYVCCLMQDLQEMQNALSDTPLKKRHQRYVQYLSQYDARCREAFKYLKDRDIEVIIIPQDIHEKIQHDMYSKLCLFMAMHPICLSEEQKAVYVADIKKHMEQSKVMTESDFEIFKQAFAIVE